MDNVDRKFVNCLRKQSEERTEEDLQYIYANLKGLEALSSLREPTLRAMCKTVRYELHEANDILYYREDRSNCWYILLSGSVFIDGFMFLPYTSFGKRTSGSGRRGTECLMLETSEMIVIDYPDVQLMKPGQRQSFSAMNLEKLLALEQAEVKVARNQSIGDEPVLSPITLRIERCQSLNDDQTNEEAEDLQVVNSYVSRSGSGGGPGAGKLAGSVTSTSDRGSSRPSSISVSESDSYSAMDLANLTGEINPDSDEEDLQDSSETQSVRDIVRDCLEKDPSDRNEDDIEILLDFIRHLPAFSNMTLAVRRVMCSVMVFAVVDKAGTVVMKDGEELDSWSVILNGHVEVTRHDGTVEELHLGDSFGITPDRRKQLHQGLMRTKVDDCQFVCIAQEDYYRILHQGQENTFAVEEEGSVVMVTEHRVLDNGNREGHIVIKATPERLVEHLMEQHSAVDPTYVEDFLMTYRTFLTNTSHITARLLKWFENPKTRDKVTRVVLLWVNNHYNDFESNPDMVEFLERFEELLEKEGMQGQLRLLNIAEAAKAKPRTVTLARSLRDSVLHFSVLGGRERGCGIFISKVERGSKAQELGLRRGDHILEVNGINFDKINHAKALEILRGSTHLSITVKTHMLAFKEMLASSERAGCGMAHDLPTLPSDPRARLSIADIAALDSSITSPAIKDKVKKDNNNKNDKEKKGYETLGHKAKLRRALAKLSILPNKTSEPPPGNRSQPDDVSLVAPSKGSSSSSLAPTINNGGGTLSATNSDLGAEDGRSLSSDSGIRRSDYPEYVVKVYRADQTCRYFLIHRETTAREVVMLSMREFSLTDPSHYGKYSLCEVSATPEGVVKQRRLPDHLSNLADRLSLNGRYYLKNNLSTDQLVPDEIAVDLTKDGQINLLQLNCVEVAIQLTTKDFEIFSDIEPTEYIDNLFQLSSRYGTDHLKNFEELVNKEMFWVITEICNEANIVKRMKLIKHYIKIAKNCKECKNFNSMFAILSGLGHRSVARLKATWDKVNSKYMKSYEDMQRLMDPSRNMSKYRNLINSEFANPPVIPFFPITKKDLTFVHLGNDTVVDSLINFEKLRMISKEVRHICRMASAQFDPKNMFDHVSSIGGPTVALAVLGAVTGPSVTAQRKKTYGRRSTGIPNPKKMWEEARMIRRVKEYLTKLNIIEDEGDLQARSEACEPPANSVLPMASAGSTIAHRRNTATSLSMSDLSTHKGLPLQGQQAAAQPAKKIVFPDEPKTRFGATSPKNLRKLLSLSEEGEKRMKKNTTTLGLVRPSRSTDPSPELHRRQPLPDFSRQPLSNSRHRLSSLEDPSHLHQNGAVGRPVSTAGPCGPGSRSSTTSSDSGISGSPPAKEKTKQYATIGRLYSSPQSRRVPYTVQPPSAPLVRPRHHSEDILRSPPPDYRTAACSSRLVHTQYKVAAGPPMPPPLTGGTTSAAAARSADRPPMSPTSPVTEMQERRPFEPPAYNMVNTQRKQAAHSMYEGHSMSTDSIEFYDEDGGQVSAV